jgi:RNA polymerase sigma factor (sigma-70 family)
MTKRERKDAGLTPQQAELFAENAAIIDRAADAVWRRFPGLNGLDLDDYRQFAALGLMRACQKFRPARGVPFAGYAWFRAWGTVMSGVRQADEVGRRRRADGLSGPKVSIERHGPHGPSGDGQAGSLRDDLPAEPRACRVESFSDLRRALAGLPLPWRFVIWMAVGLEMPAWQIADVLGLGEERVCQIKDNAFAFLALPGAEPRGRSPGQAQTTRQPRRQGELFPN